MNATDFFWGIGTFFESILSVLDGDVFFSPLFNKLLIVGGFFGLFYWLNKQIKFNKEAENNKDQLK